MEKLKLVFTEIKRVLKNTGTVWVNIGDKYQSSSQYPNQSNGEKMFQSRTYPNIINKVPGINVRAFAVGSMMQIPQRFSLMMQDELGFLVRSIPIWWKSNSKPENIRNRFVLDYEFIYLFTKKRTIILKHNMKMRQIRPVGIVG